VFKTAFDGPDPPLRHVRTRVRSPQTNGVIERWFGTLKYEHLFRGVITDGDALDMEVHRFRIIYNTIRPHQALDDRTPSTAYTGCDQLKTARSAAEGGALKLGGSALATIHAGGLVHGSQHVGEGPRQHLVDQWARQSAEWAHL
jgi:hypothetical protein